MQSYKLVAAECALLAVVLAACSPAKRYELRGQVLDKNPRSGELTVHHDNIVGFMPAMTMPYMVKDTQMFQQIKAGDNITAQVVVAGNGNDYWLENIAVTGHSDPEQKQNPNPSAALKPGDAVPDLEFTNQDGKRGHLADFRGKALLVTFIYTRCPMPDYCPRLSSAFARIHTAISKQPDAWKQAHLLSISIDPAYDSASVLRKYGLAYLDGNAAGFADWDFVFTDPQELRKLAGAFGLMYEGQDDQLTHTMVVALIGRDGKVVKTWGTKWTAQELEDALRKAAS